MIFACNDLSLVFSNPRTTEALANVSFTVEQNEFVCIVGPSGCGKTTLLRIIAGLLPPSRGEIVFSGNDDCQRPATAMVFQQQGLFPWMTVVDNVAFGLETRGVPKKERTTLAADFLSRVGLSEFLTAFPYELSGGMRQRVAILRAFLTDPHVLLMDEPFGALDAQTRILMQQELLTTWRDNPKTVIYITHDIEEAILLGDRILVMSGRPGTIQADIPIDLPRPRTLSFRQHPQFDAIYQQVWQIIESEVREGITR